MKPIAGIFNFTVKITFLGIFSTKAGTVEKIENKLHVCLSTRFSRQADSFSLPSSLTHLHLILVRPPEKRSGRLRPQATTPVNYSISLPGISPPPPV